MRQYAILSTSHGSVIIVATSRGLAEIILTKRDRAGAEMLVRKRHADAAHEPDLLPELQYQLEEYLDGRPMGFAVEMDLASLTPFQRRVLDACARIPYGQTLTYGALARRIGRPKAARAVGHALARNPVPLVIPCHRVVASDGSLGGFSAEQGVRLKEQLLDMESHRNGTPNHHVRKRKDSCSPRPPI